MRTGTPAGRVDGVEAKSLVAPTRLDELSALLAESERAGEAVVFRTNATKLDWGRPPARLDTIVDLSELPREIEHAAGDLVVRTSTSVGLAELNAEVAKAGQRLALDEVIPGSSIGGVIATGLSGPLRFGFGSVRDLLIGTGIVRADGKLAHSGGRVVKNVAGYDLGKLFAGSYGTLGAIVEAHFRLHPLPASRRYLRASFSEPLGASMLVRRCSASTLAPSAIELARARRADYTVTVLLEGSPHSVEVRAEALSALSGATFDDQKTKPDGFGELPGPSTLKLTFAPGELGSLLSALAPLLPEDSELAGAAAVGVLYLGLGEEGDLATLLDQVRAAATRAGGAAVVLRAPRAAREGLDLFGPLPAPTLQRAVKASFDPKRCLAPGRFVGEG